MGWSDSPTSGGRYQRTIREGQMGGKRQRTLKHVLDKDRALDDVLVSGELFVVGGDEKDHCGLSE
jgi:hypothetical protein